LYNMFRNRNYYLTKRIKTPIISLYMKNNILNLIKKIEKEGFYYYLRNTLPSESEYEGCCPCFEVTIPEYDIQLKCSCWRVSDFEFSGLDVKDLNNKYLSLDLENLALVILGYIMAIWTNTDWEYRINDGVKVKMF